MTERPKLQIIGSLPIDQLADLLLSGHECELCGDGPAEHYIDHGEWQGKHCCTRCWESLPARDRGEEEEEESI